MRRTIACFLGLGALAAAVNAADAPVAPASPSGQLRGTISYGRRAPAVGAVVIVRPEAAPSPVRIATTGTSGTFGFDGLPDGAYRAEVRRDGYSPVVKSGILVRTPFRAVVELLLVRGETPPGRLRPPQPSRGTRRSTGRSGSPEARPSPRCA